MLIEILNRKTPRCRTENYQFIIWSFKLNKTLPLLTEKQYQTEPQSR